MAKYRLIAGKHTNSDGSIAKVGDLVELTATQYEAFKDKFESKDKPKPVEDEVDDEANGKDKPKEQPKTQAPVTPTQTQKT